MGKGGRSRRETEGCREILYVTQGKVERRKKQGPQPKERESQGKKGKGAVNNCSLKNRKD